MKGNHSEALITKKKYKLFYYLYWKCDQWHLLMLKCICVFDIWMDYLNGLCDSV